MTGRPHPEFCPTVSHLPGYFHHHSQSFFVLKLQVLFRDNGAKHSTKHHVHKQIETIVMSDLPRYLQPFGFGIN